MQDGIASPIQEAPGRAVRSAIAFGSASKQIGLPLRAGLHRRNRNRRPRYRRYSRSCGISRYGQSKPGEILVSRVVTDLSLGAVARLVGIRVGVVSGVFNLESPGVGALGWRLRHEEAYHAD